MKATCIVGSPRAEGSCGILVEALMDGMITAGVECRKYCIGDMDIRFCIGCKSCYERGECFQNDDVAKIVADIQSSDVVVMAAPSYWAGVPGQLKTFFDRCTPYGDTDPDLPRPIKGIAVAVRAGVRPAENELILDALEHYMGHMGIRTLRRISVCETETPEDLKQRHGKLIRELHQLGENIHAL